VAEDELLSRKVREHGQRWSAILKFFDGRTANSIKNRWHLHLRGRRGKLPATAQPVITSFRPINFGQTVCRPQYPFFAQTTNPMAAAAMGHVLMQPQNVGDRPQLPPAVSLPFSPAHASTKQ
jgi:hypothetical protein